MNPDTIFLLIAFAAVQALTAWWIQARLSASIKHEYDKRLEELKREQDQRQKAVSVAEFLAEWTHVKDDTKRLNQLLWELCLYLPAPLVRELTATISESPNRKSTPQLLVAIREHILGGKDPIHEQDVPHFKLASNESMRSYPT